MNLVSDYLQSTSNNVYLDLINYNEEQIIDDFKIKLIEISQDESLSVDQAVNILFNDIHNTQTKLSNKLYSVMVYQFSPIISLFAIVFLHLKIQIWVCKKTLKFLKIDLSQHSTADGSKK